MTTQANTGRTTEQIQADEAQRARDRQTLENQIAQAQQQVISGQLPQAVLDELRGRLNANTNIDQRAQPRLDAERVASQLKDKQAAEALNKSLAEGTDPDTVRRQGELLKRSEEDRSKTEEKRYGFDQDKIERDLRREGVPDSEINRITTAIGSGQPPNVVNTLVSNARVSQSVDRTQTEAELRKNPDYAKAADILKKYNGSVANAIDDGHDPQIFSKAGYDLDEVKDYRTKNVKLTNGEYVRVEDWNKLTADEQKSLMKLGIEEFNNESKRLDTEKKTTQKEFESFDKKYNGDLVSALQDGYTKEQLESFGYKRSDIDDSQLVLTIQKRIDKAGGLYDAIEVGIPPSDLKKAGYSNKDIDDAKAFSKSNIRLQNGDWVDKSFYDTLSNEDRITLNQLGVDKYEKYKEGEFKTSQTYFEEKNVKVSGGYVPKEDWDNLDESDRTILKTKGVTEFNNVQEQRLKEFKEKNIQLKNGEWVDKKFYNELKDPDTKQYLNNFGVNTYNKYIEKIQSDQKEIEKDGGLVKAALIAKNENKIGQFRDLATNAGYKESDIKSAIDFSKDNVLIQAKNGNDYWISKDKLDRLPPSELKAFLEGGESAVFDKKLSEAAKRLNISPETASRYLFATPEEIKDTPNLAKNQIRVQQELGLIEPYRGASGKIADSLKETLTLGTVKTSTYNTRELEKEYTKLERAATSDYLEAERHAVVHNQKLDESQEQYLKRVLPSKSEFVHDVIASTPSLVATARTTGASLIPIYGTIHTWDKSPVIGVQRFKGIPIPTGRVVSIAGDTLLVIPAIAKAGTFARQGYKVPENFARATPYVGSTYGAARDVGILDEVSKSGKVKPGAISTAKQELRSIIVPSKAGAKQIVRAFTSPVEATVFPKRAPYPSISYSYYTIRPPIEKGSTWGNIIRTPKGQLVEPKTLSNATLKGLFEARDTIASTLREGKTAVVTIEATGQEVVVHPSILSKLWKPFEASGTPDLRNLQASWILGKDAVVNEGGFFTASTPLGRFIETTSSGRPVQLTPEAQALVDAGKLPKNPVRAAVIIADKDLLKKAGGGLPRLYQGALELESIFPEGTRIPPPVQYIYAVGENGRVETIAIIDKKPIPLSTLYKLKLAAPFEQTRQWVVNPYRSTTIGKPLANATATELKAEQKILTQKKSTAAKSEIIDLDYRLKEIEDQLAGDNLRRATDTRTPTPGILYLSRAEIQRQTRGIPTSKYSNIPRASISQPRTSSQIRSVSEVTPRSFTRTAPESTPRPIVRIERTVAARNTPEISRVELTTRSGQLTRSTNTARSSATTTRSEPVSSRTQLVTERTTTTRTPTNTERITTTTPRITPGAPRSTPPRAPNTPTRTPPPAKPGSPPFKPLVPRAGQAVVEGQLITKKGTVGWRQGFIYIIIPPPWTKVIYTKVRPTWLKLSSGPKSAFRTITRINGSVPQQLKIAVGFFTAESSDSGSKLKFTHDERRMKGIR